MNEEAHCGTQKKIIYTFAKKLYNEKELTNIIIYLRGI